MDGLYSIIDKFTEYTDTIFPDMMESYISTYGKDAFLLLLDVGDGKDSDDYIVAFGKNNMSYDFNDKRFYHYPIKVLVSYDNWVKVPSGIDMDLILYLGDMSNNSLPNSEITVQQGDILTFITKGKQYFYRVDAVPETYMGIIYRCSIKMASNKDIEDRVLSERVNKMEITVPKEKTWTEEFISDKLESTSPVMPSDFGIDNPEYTNGINLPIASTKDKAPVKKAVVNEYGVIEYK